MFPPQAPQLVYGFGHQGHGFGRHRMDHGFPPPCSPPMDRGCYCDERMTPPPPPHLRFGHCHPYLSCPPYPHYQLPPPPLSPMYMALERHNRKQELIDHYNLQAAKINYVTARKNLGNTDTSALDEVEKKHANRRYRGDDMLGMRERTHEARLASEIPNGVLDGPYGMISGPYGMRYSPFDRFQPMSPLQRPSIDFIPLSEGQPSIPSPVDPCLPKPCGQIGRHRPCRLHKRHNSKKVNPLYPNEHDIYQLRRSMGKLAQRLRHKETKIHGDEIPLYSEPFKKNLFEKDKCMLRRRHDNRIHGASLKEEEPEQLKLMVLLNEALLRKEELRRTFNINTEDLPLLDTVKLLKICYAILNNSLLDGLQRDNNNEVDNNECSESTSESNYENSSNIAVASESSETDEKDPNGKKSAMEDNDLYYNQEEYEYEDEEGENKNESAVGVSKKIEITEGDDDNNKTSSEENKDEKARLY